MKIVVISESISGFVQKCRQCDKDVEVIEQTSYRHYDKISSRVVKELFCPFCKISLGILL